MECDPDFADTAVFCEKYGISPDESANTILVVGKSSRACYVACVVLATTRLDVNGIVRQRLGVKKASFASADETSDLTGMLIGGVTPVALPYGIPIWVDAAVMKPASIVLGGGDRSTKLRMTPAALGLTPERRGRRRPGQAHDLIMCVHWARRPSARAPGCQALLEEGAQVAGEEHGLLEQDHALRDLERSPSRRSVS